MTDLAWMKTYIGTETALTGHLTPEEFGCYERLRRHYWQHNGLPDDDRRLMRITGVEPERWEEVRSVVCELFEEGWRLPSLDEERDAAAAQREKAVERSRKANAAKYGRRPGPPSNPQRTPSSTPTRSEENVLQGVLQGSPSASASDSNAYEGKEIVSRTYTREADPDAYPIPSNDSMGRQFLREHGVQPQQMNQALTMLMEGRLTGPVLDRITSH